MGRPGNQAVAQDGLALAYASPALKEARPVVLAAVGQHGDALAIASPKMCARPTGWHLLHWPLTVVC